jgi:HlyD family secretion protein
MTTRKKSRKLWYIVGAVVVLIAGAVVFGRGGKKGIPVNVEKAQIRSITSQVTASGNIKPDVEVTISSEVSGEIVELPVEDGDRVKKGQLLVRIDTETLESRMAQQAAGLASAKANAARALAQMQRSDQTLADQEKLFEGHFISEDTLREARMNADVNRAQYESAKASVTQSQASLDEAQKLLDKAIIYSPMDGVVSSRSVELGDRVVGTGTYQGTDIMKVADFNVMNIVIDVNETDVSTVKVGDRAKLTIDALPDTSFEGHVVEIASSATSSSSTEEAVTFKVKVRFDEPDARLRPGMTATADIDTAHADKVVAVPLQSVTVRDKVAVARATGKTDVEAPVAVDNVTSERKDKKRTRAELDNLQRIVFVCKDGIVKMRPVKTGISDNRYMEIKEGLSEGEEIVSGSYNAIARLLTDGAAVEVEKSKLPGKSGPNGAGGPPPH